MKHNNRVSRFAICNLQFLCLLFFLALPAMLFADQPFRQHRYDLFRYLPIDTGDVVFLGNSITDMHNWNEAFTSLPQGVRIVNRGVSGALTDDILANLDPILNGHPRQIFLMIGTNDLGVGRSPQQVADSVARIVSLIRSRSPQSQLFLQSILPSRVGKRTIANEQETNRLLQAIADTHSTYIDLWPLLGSLPDDADLSFDGLHLTAEGYHRWCQRIAPLIGPDVRTSYPSNAADLQQHGSLWGSNAMRATYFSLYPDNLDAILFFGDEMVKCGEWDELLALHQPPAARWHLEPFGAGRESQRCSPQLAPGTVRGRGTGWGYDGTAPSIATTQQLIAASQLSAASRQPVILYTGTGDVNGAGDVMEDVCSASIDTIICRYAAMLSCLRSRRPDSPLILLSLMPKMQPDPRIPAFNSALRRLADSLGCLYLDIYTPLANPDGSADTAFLTNNYLYGRGYRLVADSLLRLLADTALLQMSGCQSLDALPSQRNCNLLPDDYDILHSLQLSRTPQWNRHWLAVSNSFALTLLPPLGSFIASRTLADPALRAHFGNVASETTLSLLLTAAATSAVKNIVRRPRPYKCCPDTLRCLQPVTGFSFPSGHTSFAFSAATSLSLLYPKWYVVAPAYLWAASVGFSRLYIGAHYPTDVLAGALLGTTCALLTHLLRQHFATSEYRPAVDALTIPVSITF